MCGLDPPDAGQGPLSGSCEHSSEALGSLQGQVLERMIRH
jgi:hypothetical protein